MLSRFLFLNNQHLFPILDLYRQPEQLKPLPEMIVHVLIGMVRITDNFEKYGLMVAKPQVVHQSGLLV